MAANGADTSCRAPKRAGRNRVPIAHRSDGTRAAENEAYSATRAMLFDAASAENAVPGP
jgi:hypothetical protein